MTTLQIKINDKHYSIACDKGQENDLLDAAKLVDVRVKSLYNAIPNVSPELALVMCALMMQDEINELKKRPNEIKLHNETYTELQMVKVLESFKMYLEELAKKI